MEDIIVAPATATGGALAIIRMSGNGCIELTDKVFVGSTKLCDAKGATTHYGNIVNNGTIIDDVVISVNRAPHSYTSEDSIEITTHGSGYIVAQIIALLCKFGARMAEHGEFTRRAFLSGKIDLSQAEAVADIIAASSRASLAMASTQMRGGYSVQLKTLADALLNITSLLELELDFGEEEVEFANRGQLREMIEKTQRQIHQLMESFRVGNAIRNGISVAIVGEPNVGKSTLLNTLIDEDRAMVSEIAGTTRDTIEEKTTIDGITFRFVDTAGIHQTTDKLEQMGIERTNRAISKADIILQMVLPNENITPLKIGENQIQIVVVNKIDTSATKKFKDAVYISALSGEGIDALKQKLCGCFDTDAIYRGEAIVSSMRHYNSLLCANNALNDAIEAMDNNISSELLAEHIRLAINSIGEITGQITSLDILSNIFSHFCIGK